VQEETRTETADKEPPKRPPNRHERRAAASQGRKKDTTKTDRSAKARAKR
jgi:hypothetical protein